VKDAGTGVGGLSSEGEMAVFTVEIGAVLYQFNDIERAFFYKHSDGFSVAQPRACVDRVLKVQPYVIVVAQYDGDAALRVFSIRFGYDIFGEHQNPARGCESNRGAQSGNTASNYYEVCLV